MKIITCVRTRNEEHRIGQFCEAYKDADLILVADGGSEDNTVKIAESFSNTLVVDYPGRVELQRGYWRNPDSDHANFLFKYAYMLEPDWVIFDDCDIRPNFLLRKNYRKIMENTKQNIIMAVRIYLYGKDKYFPKLSSPLGEELGQTSLWAWRGNLDLWTVDVFPHFTFRIGDKHIKDFREDDKVEEVFYPYCLLHFNWDSQEAVERKLKMYRESGLIPHIQHPTIMGGKAEDLEEWMRE